MTVEFVRVKEERNWEGVETEEYVHVKEDTDLEGNARGQNLYVKIERDEEFSASELSTQNVREESVKEREQKCGNDVCVKEERDLEGQARGSFWCVKIEKDGECCGELSTSINEEVCVKEREQECGNSVVCVRDKKENDIFISEEYVHVKIEREFEFVEDEVKCDLVVGPERLQMQDIAFKLQVNNPNSSNKANAESNWQNVKGVQKNYAEEGQGHSKSYENKLELKNCAITLDSCVKEPSHQKIQPKGITYKTQIIRKRKTLETHYECHVCAKRFSKKSNLALHIQIHMGAVQYTCDVCKKQYSNYYNLKRHKQIHTGEKPHCCEICERRFTDPCNLVTHMRIHSRTNSTDTQVERKYSCKVCNKLFASPSHLESHERVHTGEKPFPCNICDKQFTSASNLKRHKRGHMGEKPYPCNICNKGFMEIRCLTKHIQKHTGVVLLYECDICKKQFKDPRTMTRHKQIHKGDTFTCEICNKTYLSLYTFHKHKKYHEMKAEGRYKDFASNKANAESNLQNVKGVLKSYAEEGQSHSKSYENKLEIKNCAIALDQIVKEPSLQKIQPKGITYKTQKIRKRKTLETHYECDVCAKRFSKRSNLALHIQIHMGAVQYTCDVCKKQYSNYYNLKRHKQIHTGEKPHCCEICERRFTDPCNLATHMRIHSRTNSTETLEKKYSCKVCNKLFASPSHLESHERVHTGEKPFSCNICDKQLTSASNLKRHIRGHTGEKPYTCDICNKRFMEIRCLTKHIQKHTGVVYLYECDICKKEFKDPRTLTRHKEIHKGDTFTCEICNKTYLSSYTFYKHKRYHKMKAEGRYKDCKYIRIRNETE